MSLILFFYSLLIIQNYESQTCDAPQVVFNHNSIEYDSRYDLDINNVDSALILNPTISLIIRGSMDKESETIEHLDLKRAEIIRNELIKRGVDSIRLFVEIEKYDVEADARLKESYKNYNPQLYYKSKRTVRFLIKNFDYSADENKK